MLVKNNYRLQKEAKEVKEDQKRRSIVMNRNLLKSKVLLIVLLILLSIAHAHGNEDPEEGFSGYVMVGFDFSTGNFFLDDAKKDDSRTINSLNQDLKRQSQFSPVLSGEITYTIGSTGTSFSMGNERGPLGFTVSQVCQSFGTVSMGINYEKKDHQWSDPFITGQPRARTDKETLGFYLGLDEILGTPFFFSYDLKSVDLDNDTAGKRDQRLKRDGTINNLNAGSPLLAAGPHKIIAGITGTLADMSGESYSYKGVALWSAYTYERVSWELEAEIYAGHRAYDALHPEFNKTRKDSEGGIETALTLHTPYIMKNTFITCFAAFNRVESNIKFFNADTASAGVLLGYHF